MTPLGTELAPPEGQCGGPDSLASEMTLGVDVESVTALAATPGEGGVLLTGEPCLRLQCLLFACITGRTLALPVPGLRWSS